MVEPTSETPNTVLVPLREDVGVALRHALRLWAESSTAPSTERREELRGYKQRAVASFFSFSGKSPGEVSALDAESWRDRLSRQKPEGQGLKANTVYARVCFLSSFFEWALRDPALRAYITSNPARLALPKAPKAYQTESIKACHSFARIVAEKTGSITDTQDALGHRNAATTRVYVQRIAVKRDKHSGRVTGRLGLKPSVERNNIGADPGPDEI